jgi:ribosomal-protein-alanine N-acetyltransferase
MNPLADDRFRKAGTARSLTAAARGTRAGLRTVEEHELPDLARLDMEIFAGDAYPYFVLRQLFDVHGDRLKVVDDGSDLCGYVLVATRQGGNRSWILGLGTRKRCRGLGYGRRLMAEAIRMSAADGVHEIRLSVDPANTAAVQLYESFGFTRDHHHDDYFGPGESRLIMALAVRIDASDL